MDCINHVSVDDMKNEIIKRYGPTIHEEFVEDMPAGRIARIYIQMKKIGPSDPQRFMKKEAKKVVPIKRRKKPYFIEGQMSLFD